MILRTVSIAVGLMLLGATCHATIAHTSGYGTPHAYVTMAIAGGVGVGALAIGAAWGQRRRALALMTLVAVVSGELFGLVMTSERLIDAREARQAPMRAAETARSDAAAVVARLTSELVGLSSPRLAAALRSKEAIDTTIAAKAAERGCAANCRHLLETQRDQALAEVVAARAALEVERVELEARVDAIRAQLAARPAPESGTPLADRLGVQPWVLDLTIAALGALGANVLAVCLLAFGAHGPRPRDAVRAAPTRVKARVVETDPPRRAGPVTDREHVSRFLMATIERDPAGVISLRALADRYPRFLATTDQPAIPSDRLGDQLGATARAIGLESEPVEGDYLMHGVRFKPG